MIRAVVLAGAALAAAAALSQSSAVPSGTWGGDGIEMRVHEAGAVVDYGCDSGTIDEPLRIDRSGRFAAKGTHTFGAGGPAREGQPRPAARQAVYEGTLERDAMRLAVRLSDLNRSYGTFTLALGAPATLDRCL